MTKTYEQLKLENQLCFRLYTASRLVEGAYNPYFEKLGITYPQYIVLLVLWEEDNQTVNAIAHRLVLETNTVTPLLQRMEKAGLVERRRGEQDARQRIISLTPKGKAMREQAKDIPTCLGASVVEKVGSVDELMTMASTLDKIIDGMKKA